MRSGFSIKRSTTPLSPHPLSRGIIPATATTKMLRLARTSTLDAAALSATTDCKGTRLLPRVSIITKGNLGQPPCRFCLTPSNKRSHFGPSVSRSIGRQCAESWHGGTRCGDRWCWSPRNACGAYDGTRLRFGRRVYMRDARLISDATDIRRTQRGGPASGAGGRAGGNCRSRRLNS